MHPSVRTSIGGGTNYITFFWRLINLFFPLHDYYGRTAAAAFAQKMKAAFLIWQKGYRSFYALSESGRQSSHYSAKRASRYSSYKRPAKVIIIIIL